MKKKDESNSQIYQNNIPKQPVKVNLKKNIPNNKKNISLNNTTFQNNINKNLNLVFKVKAPLIKAKTSNNPIQAKNNSNKINISNYIYLNKTLLLSAYEESVSKLFDFLNNYMKNDSETFEKIKKTFIKNVQKFYQRKKDEISRTNVNSSGNLYKALIKKNIDCSNKNSTQNSKTNNNVNNEKNKFHRKYKSHANKSISGIFVGLQNNSTNKNISLKRTAILNNNAKNKKINHRNKRTHSLLKNRKSLYTLMRESKPLISNSPSKDILNQKYNFSIMNNFISLTKNVVNGSKNINSSNCLSLQTTNFKMNKERNNAENYFVSEQSDINNYIIENISKNSNNIEYYSPNLSNIPKSTNFIDNNENIKSSSNNDLIVCIKNSLDDNLKGIFDFSYETFLNKESERDGNN